MIRAGILNAVARAAALAMIAVCLAPTEAEADPTMFVFGDSLADAGNVFARFGEQIPPPPYFSGRFTNGPTFVDILADRLGMATPTASLLGGTNFAFGGARTGQGTSELAFPGAPPGLIVDNLGLQVDTFLATVGTIGPDDLVVINGGGNNFLDVLLNGTTPDPLSWATELAGSVVDLAAAGGRRFLVANVPLMGMTPLLQSIGGGIPELFNALSAAFNQALDALLDALEADPALGLEIYRLDIAAVTSAGVADPARFGLSNVTDPALTPVGVVPDPDSYLFWDEIHPTRVGHRLLGEAAAAAVIPEPSSLVLSAIAASTGLLVVSARRRRAS